MSMMKMNMASVFPEIQPSLGRTIVLSGTAADIIWEIWARLITPLWVGGPLEPAALIQSVFGFDDLLLAEFIHAVVGIIFYPIGFLFVALPLQRLIFPKLPLLLTGVGFGVGLWVFALYVMAHLFAGLPPFLGFITLTWASLIGHILFGTVVAFVVRLAER
jgi:hypothetical protein